MDVLDQISTVSTPALNFWGLGYLAKQVLSNHPRHLHQRPHHQWPHHHQVSYCYFLFDQFVASQPADYFLELPMTWGKFLLTSHTIQLTQTTLTCFGEIILLTDNNNNHHHRHHHHHLSSGCQDNAAYADICPDIASCGNYCNDHKVWAQKNCPKSCNMCSGKSFTSLNPFIRFLSSSLFELVIVLYRSVSFLGDQ